jgi:hypothetical protein
MKTINLLVLGLTLVLSLDSFAQRRHRPVQQKERLILNLNGEHFRQDSVIPLKARLKRQNPGLVLRGTELIRVRVIAKSRQGRGTASLVVGNYEQDRAGISGNPMDFNHPEKYTYSPVVLQNGNDSRGNWQVHLRGNIKVLRVVIVVNSLVPNQTHCACHELDRRVEGLSNALWYFRPGPRQSRELNRAVDEGQYYQSRVSRRDGPAKQSQVCTHGNQALGQLWSRWQPRLARAGYDPGNVCQNQRPVPPRPQPPRRRPPGPGR